MLDLGSRGLPRFVWPSPRQLLRGVWTGGHAGRGGEARTRTSPKGSFPVRSRRRLVRPGYAPCPARLSRRVVLGKCSETTPRSRPPSKHLVEVLRRVVLRQGLALGLERRRICKKHARTTVVFAGQGGLEVDSLAPSIEMAKSSWEVRTRRPQASADTGVRARRPKLRRGANSRI